MKFHEAVRLLEKNGARMVRSGKHAIFERNNITFALPRSKEISIGVQRKVYRFLGLEF
jgi:hypothetical protein